LEPVWLDANGRPLENPPDIQPGDWVFGWVDNGASAQVQVGEIRASADPETGSVEGTVLAPWMAAPVAVACQDWGRDEADLADAQGGSIAADGAQTFSCAWGGESAVQDGRSIGAGYMAPDGSWVINTFFTGIPTFKAYVPGAIEGYDWPLGRTVNVSINGEYSARAVSKQRPGAAMGRTRVLFELGKDNFSIEPGDQILMTDGSTTKEGVVAPLVVTDFDVSRRAVSGVYDPASSLQVWIYDEEGEVAKADAKAGTWVATFDQLRAGALGGASQQDKDGDGTSIEFEVPQIFSISSTEDLIANDGVCTLREAILAANTNEASGSKSGECPYGLDSQVDIIELRAGEVYALTADKTGADSAGDGDLDIVDNPAPLDLIIRAEGDGRATISQDAALVDDRVLENHEATVRIENIILSGGGNVGGGGGLLNNGTLEMTGSIVTGNSAGWDGGGVYNSGVARLSIDSSSITGNTSDTFAGGIMNKGTLVLKHSEVKGNTSVHGGGGINNEGSLTIEASVLAANTSGQGGALYNSGTASVGNGTLVGGPLPEDANRAEGGGGLFSLGTLTVSDSSITGNHASYGGGLFNWTGGKLTVSNSRVSDNHASGGGGLHNKEQSTATIQDGTVFSGNYAEWGGGGIDNWGTIIIKESVLRENMSRGEAGDALNSEVKGSSATIHASCVAGNGDTAIFSTHQPSIDAAGNWWGSRSGPAHRSNPGGAGDSVSDFVDFSEWLTEPPAICAP
jgi:CSLREA domain-containing protein